MVTPVNDRHDPAPTLFVSDVHLGAAPGACAAFIAFLAGPARRAAALYVLGDLFDVWLGDDDRREPHAQILQALADLSASGVRLGVLHGNHDFLLGADFARATGAHLHPDPDVIEVHGQRLAISHGDALCTDDHDYQQWRRFSRAPEHQRAFLALPMAAREAQAASIRQRSRAAVQLKASDIMDVNEAAVIDLLRRLDVSVLVHGHTHRPALHRLQIDGRPAHRHVLGDWYEQSHVLCWDGNGPRVLSVEEMADAAPGQDHRDGSPGSVC